MITIKQAARITGGTEAWVRSACEREILGCAFGKTRKTYMVSPAKLMQWMGWTEDRLNKELKEER